MAFSRKFSEIAITGKIPLNLIGHMFWGSPPSRFEHAIRQFLKWVLNFDKNIPQQDFLFLLSEVKGKVFAYLLTQLLFQSERSLSIPSLPTTGKAPGFSHGAWCVECVPSHFRLNVSCFHQRYFTFQ